jgi:hypothetical protein
MTNRAIWDTGFERNLCHQEPRQSNPKRQRAPGPAELADESDARLL